MVAAKATVTCPECSRGFEDISRLRMHWARAHKNKGKLTDDRLTQSGDSSNSVLGRVFQILSDAGRELTIQEVVAEFKRRHPDTRPNASYISTTIRKNPGSGIVRQSRGRYAVKSGSEMPKRRSRRAKSRSKTEEVSVNLPSSTENEILRRQVARNQEVLMKLVEALMLAIN